MHEQGHLGWGQEFRVHSEKTADLSGWLYIGPWSDMASVILRRSSVFGRKPDGKQRRCLSSPGGHRAVGAASSSEGGLKVRASFLCVGALVSAWSVWSPTGLESLTIPTSWSDGFKAVLSLHG